MQKKKIALVLGIRPDVIRASILIKMLKQVDEFELVFIWSGQHYSDNLKDIFFRQLEVPKPDIELGAEGSNDAELVASIITKLAKVFSEIGPEAVIFLGDTNTVAGCIAAAQLNIPIVHIEGCMRSYDWRMPEEKYRTLIDHLADVIYTYFDEYKMQGIAEGLNPNNIVVVDNLIVDVLNEFYFTRKEYYNNLTDQNFFRDRGIKKNGYYVMTCHRRENLDCDSLQNIISLITASPFPIFFPAGYRTQSMLLAYNIVMPPNVIMVDPVGYEELLCLLVNSRGVITDSGTIVEEACVLGVPSLQMRKSTERPQVYDVGASIKFDPALPEEYPHEVIFKKFKSLFGKKWEHNLGDGRASERIVNDLIARVNNRDFNRHKPDNYHVRIDRSYRDDSIPST